MIYYVLTRSVLPSDLIKRARKRVLPFGQINKPILSVTPALKKREQYWFDLIRKVN